MKYYVNKLEKEYEINNVREYFPLKHVVKTIFQIYENLFNIRFIKSNTKYKLWHQNVVLYEIYSNKKIIGYLYLDLFSRNNKNVQTRCFGLNISSAVLVSNFDKINCLLEYQEVITLFHELGHVLHHCFGNTKHSLFSGMNVELDFIEIPALVLENLCWNANIIKKMSRHYQTGEQLNDIIINKMIKIHDLVPSIEYKQEILISLFDQLLHSSDVLLDVCSDVSENRNKELTETFSGLYSKIYQEVMKPYSLILSESDRDLNNLIIYNNNNIFSSDWINIICYENSQCHINLLSKIYAYDINSNIKNFDDFVKKLLCPGGSVPAIQILTDYLGRKPNIDVPNVESEEIELTTDNNNVTESEIDLNSNAFEEVVCIKSKKNK